MAKDLAKAIARIAGNRSVRESTTEISPFARVVARFSARNLHKNYLAIEELVPGQAIMPMIKANAYGHGAVWAARQLLGMSSLYGFGVATFEEAEELREKLGAKARGVKIVVFSGVAPWSEEKGLFCEKLNLTPVLATENDWLAFLKGGWPGRISYELKFNTGMHRLGIPISVAPSIVKVLKNKSSDSKPSGILSHLAVADDPDWRLSQTQREKFMTLRSEFDSICPSAQFHLAASGGIWNEKLWGLKGMTDVVRPGIALYGVVPWAGASEKGINPVLSLYSMVVHLQKLKRGDSTGYGGGFTNTTNEIIPVAVIASGYADGVIRALGNRGYAWVNGSANRFLGNVSMDMATVGCDDKTKVGDWVEILGPNVDIWAQAKAAGTIPYELLTSISHRVQRIYD